MVELTKLLLADALLLPELAHLLGFISRIFEKKMQAEQSKALTD